MKISSVLSIHCSLIACLAASSAFAAESFEQGQLLTKDPGAVITLKDKKGREARFSSGPVQLTVSNKGLFGDGYLEVKSNGDDITVKIPRKSYEEGKNFLAYSSDSGQDYTMKGSIKTETAYISGPTPTMQSCTYNGTVIGNMLICHGSFQQFPDNQAVSSLCSGNQLVNIETDSQKDVYQLEFFSPSDPNTAVGVIQVDSKSSQVQKVLNIVQQCQ